MTTETNKYQDFRLVKIEGHIEKINEELGQVKRDVWWIKKFLFLLIPVLFSSIFSLLVLLFK